MSPQFSRARRDLITRYFPLPAWTNPKRSICVLQIYAPLLRFSGIDVVPIFALFRSHSTLKPMRSSSVWNLTTTTSAPSSYWISPSWAPTQSRWKPRWWMRMASSGRRDQRPQYLWNHLRILTHSSSVISSSRAELSLLHRGVHTLVSELFVLLYTVLACVILYIFVTSLNIPVFWFQNLRLILYIQYGLSKSTD